MLRSSFAFASFAVSVTLALGQTQTTQSHKTSASTTKKATASAHPNPNAATKVTGPGTTMTSGLQYWDIKVGTGPAATKGQTVKVHYTGWLTNGKKFDSSVGGQPFTFVLGAGQVIKGWDEGVVGMRVDGKRQLRIPPDLAYGASGTPGGPIPPNATLIFDVQLLGVQ